MRFALGLLQAVPMLKQQITGTTQEWITLRNDVQIEIHTASYRSTRGYTIVAALLDEIAYWPIDENAAEPDVEVINAIRPGMATIPGARLLCASSPHSRRGALFEAWRKHFGKDGDPSAGLASDHARHESELCRSLSSTTTWLPIRPVLPPNIWRNSAPISKPSSPAKRSKPAPVGASLNAHRAAMSAYIGFIDATGGSGSDSMALAIGCYDYASKTVVIDCLREHKPPFSPEIVASEFSALLRSYHLTSAYADRWGGDWVKEQFSKFGISHRARSEDQARAVSGPVAVHQQQAHRSARTPALLQSDHWLWNGAAAVVPTSSIMPPVSTMIWPTVSPVSPVWPLAAAFSTARFRFVDGVDAFARTTTNRKPAKPRPTPNGGGPVMGLFCCRAAAAALFRSCLMAASIGIAFRAAARAGDAHAHPEQTIRCCVLRVRRRSLRRRADAPRAP